MERVFIISEVEVQRRTNAFTAFLISLFLSFSALSLWAFPELIADNLIFSAFFVLGMVLLVIGLRQMTAIFFRSYLQTKVVVTGTYLERITARSDEKFMLAEITKIRMRKTSREGIRDIGVFLNNRCQYFDGLADFESFGKLLTSRCGKNVKVEISKEPLDYDSITFYPTLGFIVGAGSLLLLKAIAFLDSGSMHFVYVFFTLYTAALGGYFFVKKPLTVRYGHGSKGADYLWGLFMLGVAIIMGILAVQ